LTWQYTSLKNGDEKIFPFECERLTSEKVSWEVWCQRFIEQLQENRFRRRLYFAMTNLFRDLTGRGKNPPILGPHCNFFVGDFSAGIPKQSGDKQTQNEKIGAPRYKVFLFLDS